MTERIQESCATAATIRARTSSRVRRDLEWCGQLIDLSKRARDSRVFYA